MQNFQVELNEVELEFIQHSIPSVYKKLKAVNKDSGAVTPKQPQSSKSRIIWMSDMGMYAYGFYNTDNSYVEFEVMKISNCIGYPWMVKIDGKETEYKFNSKEEAKEHIEKHGERQ